MNKIKHLLLLTLFCIAGTSVFAQKGARISGSISSDSEGALIMVNVTERDKTNRIINAAVTDFEGNFSMVVKNTENELEISYVGYKTQRLPIGSRTVFNVKMKEDNVLDDIVIEASEVRRSGGLDILEREMTHATQKISMEEMQGLSFSSVDEALQGQIAGLDVVMGSGSLGAGTQMRLRGISTLESGETQPLIVVDDNIFEVPESEDFSQYNEDKFAELLMINTEDIAEIEVLKDGASCAIWGPKAANGVIKIKTKRGKRGPTRVNFTYKFKDKWTANTFNTLNGDDYTMYMKQALFNRNNSEVNIPELNYDQSFSEYENYNNNTDWVDAVSKHGYRNEYTLNLNGGGEKATFRVAGSYSSETGQVIGEEMTQLSSRLALDYFVSQRIKVVADFSFSYTKNEWKGSSLMSTAVIMMPNMSVYKQDDNGNNTDEFYNVLADATSTLKDGMTLKNPVAAGTLEEHAYDKYIISPQVTFEYDLLGLEENETALKYRGMVYLNAATSNTTSYTPSSLNPQYVWSNTGNNQSYASDDKSLGFTTRHNLVFTPYLGSRDHFLQMNAQFELYTSSGNSQSSTSKGLPTGNITSSTVSSQLSSTGSSKWESRSVSFVYDAHYSYKSKYMLRLSVRGEGLTSLGDDKKWIVFPAISGRWNVIDEPWMQWAKPVVSMFSLRPGYSFDGHVPSGTPTFNKYSAVSSNGTYLGVGAYQMDNIRLTHLSASDKREFNIGSDFGFFNDKLTGSFNYYVRTEYDQLVSGYKIPTTTGYSSLTYKNSGTVRNTGWEVNFNTAPVKLFKDFSVSMYFNIGNNYNEILEAEEAWLEEKNGTYESAANGTYLGRVQVGNPKGGIYGFRYKGVYRYSYKNWEKALSEAAAGRNGTCPIVYDANGNVVYNADGTPKRMTLFYDRETQSSQYEFKGGDAIYEDINNDGTINQLDIVYLGNSNPKAQGGFGFTFRYKKLTLKTNFSYRYGIDVVNYGRMSMENMATFNNQSVAVNYRWRKEGDITEIPRAVYGSTNAYNYLGSDRFVEDASYLRLSYLQLSYQFEPDWLKKFGLRNLTLYASADNLIHWSKYTGLDPDISWNGTNGIAEDNVTTPRARSYTVSVSLGF